ncbi:microtubule-associated protein futsch-like [Uranotaenia lowii]|uniref:microtubule-associated protein futsch-like n=1 Tax=Uranotaenia lowii TaxID=190385 RepID=UPI00247A8743|nr:microtubule-associated protein futsch-like [Uranotaenia lowii]
MYKLREERLKALYDQVETPISIPTIGFIMENTNTKFGITAKSTGASHGDSLADHSFESFKTKEIRDSESPTRFGTVIPSDNSGWNITTSEELSTDGKTHTVRSTATTEGTKDIKDGRTSFAGRNEEAHSERMDGDDKNFVHSKGDQSSTYLAENTVIEGDDGCKIQKKSSSVTTSSSRVIRSHQTTSNDDMDFAPIKEFSGANSSIKESNSQKTTTSSSTREEKLSSSQQSQEVDGNIASKPLSRDPDRVSEAFKLLEQPGQILSKDVVMINPTTKQITITKKLDDGTTVTTRSFEKTGQVETQHMASSSSTSTTVSKSQSRRESEASTFHKQDEIENRNTKRDISDKITNQQFILDERADRERSEHVETSQSTAQHKISVDMSAAHDSFARSLRCVSPTGSVRSVRSTSTTGRSSVSPDKSRRDRRSPSRDSDTSRFSSHTTTRTSRSELSNRDYMKPTITSERKQSTFKESSTQESTFNNDSYDSVERTTSQKERSASPKKVPQNTPDMTPRGPSPDKLSRHASPSKTPKEGSPFCSVDMPESKPTVKRDIYAQLIRESSSDKFDVDTTITVSTSGKSQRQIREDVEVFDTSKQITDLDDITVNVKLENVTDDIEVTTTVEEVDVDSKDVKKTTGKQKPPLRRTETFEERCRKILGMGDKTDSVEKGEENKNSIFSTYDNTITRTSEMREKRKKIEQEVKTIETEAMKSARRASEFINSERRTSSKNISPTRRPSEAMKETSPVRKVSKEPSPVKSTSPMRKHSQPSPERRPVQSVKEPSPVRKYSQPSPERRLKEERPKEQSPVRKQSHPSPDRRMKEDSPSRKLSEVHRCSRSHERSPTPTEKSPTRKTSNSIQQDTSPIRKISGSPTRKTSQTETIVTKSTSTSKADILVSQKKEGKNLSITEITIQPVIETKKSDKILTKQTSDNRFERRSTSSKVVTNKSSSDFDVKRRAALDKTESVSDRTSRITGKTRTPATSPDKRRPQDVSPTKQDKTKNHITVAKIKIEPVRKPIHAKVIVEDRSNRATSKATAKTTRKFVEDLVVESDKDTGISENEYDDDMVTTVKTTTTTVTTTKKHPVSERKDSGPMNKTSRLTSRISNENILKSNNVAASTNKRSSLTTKSSTVTNTASSTRRTSSDRPVKCITTKTINLSTKPMIESDNLDNVVIDIQQAKSSREPTPNKLIPIPVSPEEDTGKPRFPDTVQEPDDEPKPAPKVNNIPIFEEATNDYIGCEITEVEDQEVRAARAMRITNLDRVTEDDESLLSVTEKVSKFAEEANRLNDVLGKTPNRFVRQEFDDLDEHLKSDECLLSVSDKVTKFISTAEEVKKIKTSGPFVPECKVTIDVTESDECLLSVNDKISKFAHGANTTSEMNTSSVSVTVDDVDRSMVEVDDESLLSVSEKKKKFISAAGTPQKSPELVKNVMKQTTRHERVVDEDSEDQKANITERYTTATLTKPREKVTQNVGLRSTEAVKKAKQIFETGNKAAASELAKQKDILSRPSIWEDRRKKEQTTVTEEKQTTVQETNKKDVKLTDIGVFKKAEDVEPKDASKGRRDSGTNKTPAYIRDTVSNKKDLFEKRISSSKLETSEVAKSKSVQEDAQTNVKRSSITEKYERSISKEMPAPGNKPSYMSHTVCSLEHINSGRRESVDQTQRSGKIEEQQQTQQETVKSTNKFGVELKRMDSGRNVGSNTATLRRKSSVDTTVIEEIFDLETLEKMLEAVTGYEQRRRIRAQIRLAKKMGEKSTTTTTTTTTTTVKMNGRVRDVSPKRKTEVSPTRAMRKISQDVEIKLVEKQSEPVQRSVSPSKAKPTMNGKATTTTTSTITTKTQKVAEKAPQKDVTDKPIWATTNILKKASETTRTFKTNSTVTSTKKPTNTIMREVPKETKPTDCITSSYGVGPTDENGLPLFGIRALKKKPAAPAAADMETSSKISGSFMSETLYSENGGPAVGERKTMLYSSDAKDFDDLRMEGGNRKLSDVRDKLLERENSRKGLISVTKTEKISNGGSHVTTEVGILDDGAPRDGKVVRKGSVKELTERFVHKESSSSLLSEKTYPKAGLILRSTQSHSSRSSTPCEISSVRSGSVEFDENDLELRSSGSKSTVRESLLTSSWSGDQKNEDEDGVVFRKSSSSSSSRQTRSFLNDSSRVSGVQDVLDRMRNADNVEETGDSVEDREARALLNKFLGASVLMSGMESMVASRGEESSSIEGSSMPGVKTVSHKKQFSHIFKSLSITENLKMRHPDANNSEGQHPGF